MSDSEEEEDEDDRHNEDLKDLIDDRPIEDDESDGDSDGSGRSAKRKKSDDDDELDDRLEDEDYDLIEENLGVKVERRVSCFFLEPNRKTDFLFEIFQKKFKRLRRIQEDESDNERDAGDDREQIADQLFVAGSDDVSISCCSFLELFSIFKKKIAFLNFFFASTNLIQKLKGT